MEKPSASVGQNNGSQSKTQQRTHRIDRLLSLVVLVVLMVCGMGIVGSAALAKLQPEKSLVFDENLQPKAGAPVGRIIITLTPNEAFVVGDKIHATVEVQVNWIENDSAMVLLVFPQSWSVVSWMEWANYAIFEQPIILKYVGSSTTYAIYQEKLTLWYTHEGSCGVRVTVLSPYTQALSMFPFATTEGTIDFVFPLVVQINPYGYLEQRQTSFLAGQLNQEILGLAVIALGPIFAQVIKEASGILRNNDTAPSSSI